MMTNKFFQYQHGKRLVVTFSNTNGIDGNSVESVNKVKFERTDSKDISNNPYLNMEPTSKREMSNISLTDNSSGVYSKNISSEVTNTLNLIAGTGQKIDSEIFWDEVVLDSHYETLTTSNKAEDVTKKYDSKILYQIEKVQSWVEKDVDTFFKGTLFATDNGTDIINKTSKSGSTEKKPNIINKDSYSKHSYFTSKGSDSINWIPYAIKIFTEKLCSVLITIMIKLMSLESNASATLDNQKTVVRTLDEYSIINNVKLNYIDSNNVSVYQLSQLEDVNGITGYNIHVSENKYAEHAAFIHLTCMFRTPFYNTDPYNEKMFMHQAFNFSDGIKLEYINIIVSDPVTFKYALTTINANWWQSPINQLLAETFFRENMPHKYSSYQADGFLLIVQAISSLLLSDVDINLKLQIPINTIMTTIGVYKILEPQFFGLSQANLELSEFISCNALKNINLKSIVNSIYINTVKGCLNLSSNGDQDVDIDQASYDSSVDQIFDGAMASDSLYNMSYSTYGINTFFIFCPNFLKQLYFSCYPNYSTDIYGTTVMASTATNFLSFIDHNLFPNFNFPDIFNNGMNLGLNKFFGNMVITTNECIDVVRNIFLPTSTNFSSHMLEISLDRTENNLYARKSEKQLLLDALNDVWLKVELTSVSLNMLSGKNTEGNLFSTWTNQSSVFVIEESRIQFFPLARFEKKLTTRFKHFEDLILNIGRFKFSSLILAKLTESLSVLGKHYVNHEYHVDFDYAKNSLSVISDKFTNGDKDYIINLLKDEFNITVVFIEKSITLLFGNRNVVSSSSDTEPLEEEFSGDVELGDQKALDDFFLKMKNKKDNGEKELPKPVRKVIDTDCLDLDLFVNKSYDFNNKQVLEINKVNDLDKLCVINKYKDVVDYGLEVEKFGELSKSGYGINKRRALNNIDVDTTFNLLHGMVKKELVKSAKYTNTKLTLTTNNDQCVYQTALSIITRQKIKLGKNFELAYLSLTNRYLSGKFGSLNEFRLFLTDFKLNVILMFFDTGNFDTSITLANKVTTPSEIVILYTDLRHVGILEHFVYLQLSNELNKKFELNHTIVDVYMWRLFYNLIITRSQSFETVAKYLRCYNHLDN